MQCEELGLEIGLNNLWVHKTLKKAERTHVTNIGFRLGLLNRSWRLIGWEDAIDYEGVRHMKPSLGFMMCLDDLHWFTILK